LIFLTKCQFSGIVQILPCGFTGDKITAKLHKQAFSIDICGKTRPNCVPKKVD
jgi:hypothetical protein